jgi:hypothetical protein
LFISSAKTSEERNIDANANSIVANSFIIFIF